MSSSGVGESVGTPTQLSARELETTAATEVAKAVMRIVSDTIDLNFFLLDEGVRKYQSPASRPNLTSPLSSVRVATSFTTPADQRWQIVYEKLTQALPKDVQLLLSLAMQLPIEQRGAHVMVLDSLLQSTAKMLVLLSFASQGIEASSLPGARAEGNQLAPAVAFAASVQADRMLLTEALKFLLLVGPNHSDFNALAGYMGDLNAISIDIGVATKMLQHPETFQEGMDKIAASAAKVADLSHRFDTLYGGGELRLLGAMLHASESVTAALTLEKGGSGALLIALSLANAALGDSRSESSAIGPGLSLTLGGIALALQQVFVPAGDVGSQQVLQQLSMAALVGAIVFGALTYEQGVSIKASESMPEVRAEKNFAYGLVLTLLSKMDVLSTLAGGIASATNLPAEEQSKVGALLSTAALLLLIASAAKGQDATSLEPLIADLKSDLKQGVEHAADFVSAGLLSGKLHGENWESSNVYLQQASMALQEGDSHAFLDAMNSLLGLSGTSQEDVLGDIGKLADFARVTLFFLQASSDEVASNCTGIYSPA